MYKGTLQLVQNYWKPVCINMTIPVSDTHTPTSALQAYPSPSQQKAAIYIVTFLIEKLCKVSAKLSL